MDSVPNLRTEIAAGVTTFFTMAYIVVVNPGILSATGMPFDGVLTATVLVAFLATLLMGLWARLPYALAPGMGINAFFTYTIVLGRGVPWTTALGIVFWSGVLFLIASVTPLRVAIARAIPRSLRIAAAAGIGLFLTFIGLKSCGLVVADPVTFVRPGRLGPESLLALAGLVVMVVLLRRKSPLAFLAGIALATAGGALIGKVVLPETLVRPPDFGSVFLELDLLGALELALVPSLVALLFTDLFDSLSTFIGVAHAAKLVDDEGQPLRLEEALVVDSIATLSAGLFGSSSGTTYIESTAGIEAGGRTGRTAIVTALCFLPCLFLSPLAAMVPGYATGPVLVLVGALMFRPVAELPMEKLEEALPAFLALVLIPLTFSITQGILWGLVAHAALFVLAGRRRELGPTMIALALVAAGLLALESSG